MPANSAAGSSLLALQRVTVAAHRRDAGPCPRLGEPAAQMVDVNIERVGADLLVERVETGEQRVAMDRFAGAAQQELKQRNLARPQRHHLAIDEDDAALLVEDDIGKGERLLLAHGAAPGD